MESAITETVDCSTRTGFAIRFVRSQFQGTWFAYYRGRRLHFLKSVYCETSDPGDLLRCYH